MRAAEDGDLKYTGVKIYRDLNILQFILISIYDYQAATAFTVITNWEENVTRQYLCVRKFSFNRTGCRQFWYGFHFNSM